MTCDELKRIPLISLLQYLQIPCSKLNSREAWLKNPFNGGNEKTPSTKIDIRKISGFLIQKVTVVTTSIFL